MIVENLAVESDQWISFLCCYVVCEMDKKICPLPRTEFNKKFACTNETAAQNLCNERLEVLC